MAPTKTRTVKNKHSAAKSAPGKRSATDGVTKSRKPKGPAPPSKQVKDRGREALLKKFKNTKKKTYSEEELGIPKLNMITPVGVVKPKGKKKGKVFVDDREGMNTILSIVQAEKNGQIESKMIKARQMEEIREARKVEAEKREGEKKAKLEDTKNSLRKTRKRKSIGGDDDDNLKEFSSAGTKASKSKSKKRVSFA